MAVFLFITLRVYQRTGTLTVRERKVFNRRANVSIVWHSVNDQNYYYLYCVHEIERFTSLKLHFLHCCTTQPISQLYILKQYHLYYIQNKKALALEGFIP